MAVEVNKVCAIKYYMKIMRYSLYSTITFFSSMKINGFNFCKINCDPSLYTHFM